MLTNNSSTNMYRSSSLNQKLITLNIAFDIYMSFVIFTYLTNLLIEYLN